MQYITLADTYCHCNEVVRTQVEKGRRRRREKKKSKRTICLGKWRQLSLVPYYAASGVPWKRGDSSKCGNVHHCFFIPLAL